METYHVSAAAKSPVKVRGSKIPEQMRVEKTKIPEVLVFEPEIHADRRGSFVETFQAERYATFGLSRPFVQDNLSQSEKGVLRGLHLQNPRGQGRLVTALHGRVLDVAVDVRKGSPTFGRHVAVELNETNLRQLWVPRGFAHGFVVLSERADLFYKCDEFYNPSDEIAISWNDPQIGIDWSVRNPILSDRDASAPFLKDVSGLPSYGGA